MNFLTSGKLGDFIHTLYVVKYYSLNNNNINLHYHSKFLEGLDLIGSFNSLKSLADKQPYINSFKIYDDVIPIDVNLTDFRYNHNINNFGWTDLLIDTHRMNKKNCLDWIKSWIETDIDERYQNKIIIHRSNKKMKNETFPWKKLLGRYRNENDIIFVSFDEQEFNSFLREYDEKNIEFVKVNNMYELSVIINSCKLFIGNQSMPFCMASALNKDRVVEICGEYHLYDKWNWYIDECKYYNNLIYYQDEIKNNLYENIHI